MPIKSLVLLLSVGVFFSSAAVFSDPTMASDIKNLDQLLQQVKNEQRSEKQLYQQREQRFLADKKQQQRLLTQAKNVFLQEQKKSNPILAITQQQQEELDALQAELKQQAMELGDIYSLYQQFSADFAARMEDSVIQTQLPERKLQIAQLQQQELPSIDDMRLMWLLVQQEMTEASKNRFYQTEVVSSDGKKSPQQALRLGTFSAISEQQFLSYIPETQELLALDKQPTQQQLLTDLTGQTGLHVSVIDPTRGELLAVLGQSPGLYERILQGREVGMVIIAIAIIGLLLALIRGLYLLAIWSKMRAQLQRVDEPKQNNPLGRVFLQVKNLDVSKQEDEELLQLSLDEAILKEIPALERGHSLIKLIAALAPLLGLLGTVIGMIATFQSISLFGSGDPKLMASGISQALVTTVLGLVAAIPLLLCHNLLTSFSKALIQLLDEQSAGILVRDKEQQHGGRA